MSVIKNVTMNDVCSLIWNDTKGVRSGAVELKVADLATKQMTVVIKAAAISLRSMEIKQRLGVKPDEFGELVVATETVE